MKSVPKCKECGWTLAFTSENGRWVARCWNPLPGACSLAGEEVEAE